MSAVVQRDNATPETGTLAAPETSQPPPSPRATVSDARPIATPSPRIIPDPEIMALSTSIYGQDNQTPAKEEVRGREEAGRADGCGRETAPSPDGEQDKSDREKCSRTGAQRPTHDASGRKRHKKRETDERQDRKSQPPPPKRESREHTAE